MLVVGRGFCALRHVDYEGVLGRTRADYGASNHLLFTRDKQRPANRCGLQVLFLKLIGNRCNQ